MDGMEIDGHPDGETEERLPLPRLICDGINFVLRRSLRNSYHIGKRKEKP
jgi:hypothetical protein